MDNATATDMLHCVEANADITGVGVRVSFYLQTIAIAVLSCFSFEEALNSLWALIATSFGLALAVLITAVQRQPELRLQHAIVAGHLISLTGITIHVVLAAHFANVLSLRLARSRQSVKILHRTQAAIVLSLLQTVFSSSCMMYIWIHASELTDTAPGSAPKAVYVIAFIRLSATGRGAGRVIALLLLAFSVMVSLIMAVSAFRFIGGLTNPREGVIPSRHSVSSDGRTNLREGVIPSPHSASSDGRTNLREGVIPSRHSASSDGLTNPREGVIQQQFSPLPSSSTHGESKTFDWQYIIAEVMKGLMKLYFVVGLLVFVGFWAVAVGTIEYQIAQDHFCAGNNAWGFAQILALTVAMGPVLVAIEGVWNWKMIGDNV
ncbi:hypothetical protein C8F01DRAFT_625499 [Mycena amicta]|nr:hypothetical protein C8F01DRAFT_625499 [Mycena amicta]